MENENRELEEISEVSDDYEENGLYRSVGTTVLLAIIALSVIAGLAYFAVSCYIGYQERQRQLQSFQNGSFKPIIYLYPEEETELSVTLGKPENITCSYPEYADGWNVIAKPDGTLTDTDTGKNLYSLYWEGINDYEFSTEDGFIVKGSDTVSFLEEKLALLGLNYKEAEEFIIYWLPKLQENKYNYIRFATKDEIDKNMPLEFSEKPDTTIRILMLFKGLDEYKEVPEQTLETPERTGFVAVEWGGSPLN